MFYRYRRIDTDPKNNHPVGLVVIAIVAALLVNSGVVKVIALAAAMAIGRFSGLMSTAYCVRVAILAAASIVVFRGATNTGLFAAVIIASSWHFWSVIVADQMSPGAAARRQQIFFDAIFSLLGYIAKADGVVCGREINFASLLMTKMKLNEERRADARRLFERGKIADFDIDKTLEKVRKECKGSIGMFMRILADAAAVNGQITEVESRILHYVGTRLGLSASEVEQIEAAVGSGGQYQSYQSRSGQSGHGGQSEQSRAAASGGSLLAAYKILGVMSNASNGEIKKHYRRLMSRHHPDKLVAKGMPPEMMRVATERAQEISSAYNRIKQARGI